MKKHKRGGIREDGMVFWQYRYGGTEEYWVKQDKFNAMKEAEQVSSLKRRRKLKSKYDLHPRTHRCGDVREDGMVFWHYNIICKGFEKWVTKDEFKRKQEVDNLNRKNRYNKDPLYRLKILTRGRIGEVFSNRGFNKDTKTADMLGCSWVELRDQFTSLFSDGMTWGNQGVGGWVIDHILPLDAAKNEAELKKLNHHSNLQPMWERDNAIKGNNYCPIELEEYLCA